jgi:membrane protein YdbS with pleckstrin-like domain
MTNSPEATPDAVPPAEAGAPTHATAHTTPQQQASLPVEGDTFTRLAEPRSENRLVLESGVWHQISPKYVRVQFIANGSFLLLVVAATLVLTLLMHQWWAWIPGGLLTVILVWTLAILPRQARSIGYQLRQDDLVFRRGILWQRFVAVPYGRMQLIDITHGPLDRGFGIAQLKFVTAAAATGVVIPGLEQATADTLRDHLVGVAESRRTGL